MGRIKSLITIVLIVLLIFVGGVYTNGNTKISYNLLTRADYLTIDRLLDLVQIQILQTQILYILMEGPKREKPITFNPILYYDRNTKLITATIFVDEQRFKTLEENRRKIELNESVELISDMIKRLAKEFEKEKDLKVEFLSFGSGKKIGEFINGNLWLLLR